MVDESLDGLLADLLSKASSLGIDISSFDMNGEITNDKKMEISIRLLRAMFEIMRQGLVETTSELEHMYDACYQTFHDSLEPIRNIWKLSGIMISDQCGEVELDPRYAEVIHTSSHFLMMVMDDLMHLMVLRRRRDELSERFSLTLAADQAVEHLFSNISERGGVVTIDRDLPIVISNRSRWTRIFQNLIKNGLIYNRSDKPVVSVSYCDGIISVVDNGMGIHQSDISKIFGLFTRLKDRKHMAEGTGSGLYQVSRLLSDDHAVITVDSKVGKGSTFRIDIRTLIRDVPSAL